MVSNIILSILMIVRVAVSKIWDIDIYQVNLRLALTLDFFVIACLVFTLATVQRRKKLPEALLQDENYRKLVRIQQIILGLFFAIICIGPILQR